MNANRKSAKNCGATHIDEDDDYWIITPANCFIWNSSRETWDDYANFDEVDMSKLQEISQ
ncbi:hypothetical protein [Acinetobacter sp. A47]|uniref:hypothetical protein n=1 Tax=Acinetobacter sp. A47 TaxID=1561217 RepID=UPI00056FD4F7|nr:hypothetical protein [Acinetobacter sp. A47]